MPVDPTDEILLDERLTEKDRDAMVAFANKNKMKKDNNIFDKVRENENVEKMDFAVKALLSHLLKSRGNSNGDT